MFIFCLFFIRIASLLINNRPWVLLLGFPPFDRIAINNIASKISNKISKRFAEIVERKILDHIVENVYNCRHFEVDT